MKRLLSALLILCLLLSLAACSGASSAPAAGGAGPDAGPESPASSAPASSAPACEHDWQPATFAAPETCAKCGETRGGAKQTFFAENGLEVGQLPDSEVPITYVVWLRDEPSVFLTPDNGAVTLSQTVADAEDPDYKLVTLSLEVVLPIVDRENILNAAYNYSWGNGIYDLYTGQVIPTSSTFGDSTKTLKAEVKVDGTVYPVQCVKTTAWESTGWYEQEEGFYENDATCHWTLECLVPKGYDGLTFALLPTLKPPQEDDRDRSPLTVLEDIPAEALPGTVFFRFGQDVP